MKYISKLTDRLIIFSRSHSNALDFSVIVLALISALLCGVGQDESYSIVALKNIAFIGVLISWSVDNYKYLGGKQRVCNILTIEILTTIISLLSSILLLFNAIPYKVFIFSGDLVSALCGAIIIVIVIRYRVLKRR